MSARAKFIEHANRKQVAAKSWDAMMMASSHDPDHAKELKRLGVEIRRALRWCERLYVRIGKVKQ